MTLNAKVKVSYRFVMLWSVILLRLNFIKTTRKEYLKLTETVSRVQECVILTGCGAQTVSELEPEIYSLTFLIVFFFLSPFRVKISWPRRFLCGNRPARTLTSCQRGPWSWPSRWALLPLVAQAHCILPNQTWSSQTPSQELSLSLCPQSWLCSWEADSDIQQ